MNAALLSLAIVGQLGGPFVIQVGDRVPVIDVEKTCKETAATDKAMNLDLSQSVANCMRDENAAQQQLATICRTIPRPFAIAARRKPPSSAQAAMLTC